MKTATQNQARYIGILLVAGTIGLLLLMHITSARQQCLCRETYDIGLLKLI